MDETKDFGKGAVVAPPEIQDKLFKLSAGPVPPIDWSTPYMVPANLTTRNQKSSSSCTAQATNYYVEALNQIDNNRFERYSARHNYSQANLGYGQGAYIWKAMSIPLKGAASFDSVPDKDSSELIMIDASDNAKGIIEVKTDKYAVIPRNGQGIDYMAQIIRDYHGFVTGFNGYDGMFDSEGMIVDWSKVEWGHAVYVCGYEMHKGKKCLKFINSWGDLWGSNRYGYMPEEFVLSGLMFDAYVYALTEDLDPTSMNNRLVKLNDVNSKDIFLVVDGKKTLVYNVSAFKLLGGNIDLVEKLTQDQLNALPDSGIALAGIVQE